MRKKNGDYCGKLMAMFFLLLLNSSNIFANQLIVSNASAAATTAGSLSYAINSALLGDTIMFNIPGTDEMIPGTQINKYVLQKDLVIQGKNLATGNKVKVMASCFLIKGCKIRMSDLIIRAYNRGNYAIVDSGKTTEVWLENVEIRGDNYWDNDSRLYTAVLNYNGATLTMSNCIICSNSYGGLRNSKGKVTMTNSTVYLNFSNGGLCSGLTNDDGVMTIYNSTIRSNYSSSPGYMGGWNIGAGIINRDGVLTIFNSTIYRNNASSILTWSVYNPSANAAGGGIFSAGSDAALVPAKCSIFNSTICFNKCIANTNNPDEYANIEGGGAYLDGESYVSHCTFFNDTIQGQGKYYVSGPEIYQGKGTAFYMNSIFARGNYYSSIYFPYANYGIKGKNNLSNDSLHRMKTFDSTVLGDGFSVQQLFGRDSVKLDSIGGTTRAFALSKGAVSIGTGIRNGYYTIDTVLDTGFNLKGTIYIPAYYAGTSWISARTTLPVPSGAKVVEIATDQRGLARNNPPCVGAIEWAPGDDVSRVNGNAFRLSRSNLDSYFDGNTMFIISQSQSMARVEIFQLNGRIVFSRSIMLNHGKNSIILQFIPHGIAVCKIRTTNETLIRKIMR